MVYRIPSLTDFTYKNPDNVIVDAEEAIESIYEQMEGTYVFKGWITEDLLKDIIYPGETFTLERLQAGKPQKAFYVDDSIKLWDDCSENYPETEANPNIRDICIPGRDTRMVFTNWWDWLKNEYGAESAEYASWGPPLSMSATATVMSSAFAPETGYFFKLPIGTQLSVAPNDNFKNIVQFDGATGTWTNSFSMDMWAKVAYDSMIVDEPEGSEYPPYSRTMRQVGQGSLEATTLLLANRSLIIQDFAKQDQKYDDTGYDMYFQINRGQMYASNFDSRYSEVASGNECMRTGTLSSNFQQPGHLSAEWGNILYGWTYFAFSYNASTKKLVGYVKSNNADFKWEGDVGVSSQIIQDPAAHVPDVARDYGFLVGSNGIRLVNYPGLYDQHKFAWAPGMSVKCFRIYDRAVSYDEFHKIWEYEHMSFRPNRIRTRMTGLSADSSGNLKDASIYLNSDNWNPYMYTKVVTSCLNDDEEIVWNIIDSDAGENPDKYKGKWDAAMYFPRQLSDYMRYDAGTGSTSRAFLQKVPSALFLGWSMQSGLSSKGNTQADIAKISAENIYNFETYPEDPVMYNGMPTVISVGRGYAMRRQLYPVVLGRAVYINKANQSAYYNYGCGAKKISVATSAQVNADIGIPQQYDGGNLLGYWCASAGPYSGDPSAYKFADFGQEITTWNKLSMLLYIANGDPRPTSYPFHLYPVYKKETNVSPTRNYAWYAKYTSPRYQDIDVSVTLGNYQPFAGIHDTLLKDIQTLTANFTLSTQTPNNKDRFISLLLSVNVDRGGGNHDTIYHNTSPLTHVHGQGEGKTEHSVTISVPSNQSGNLNNVYLTLSARCLGIGSENDGELGHYRVLANFSKITRIEYK